MKQTDFTIWIDADACPKVVKELVFKASAKFNIKVVLVANSYLQIPHTPLIRLIQVEQGDDVADNYISENLTQDDIVITQDIPLASIVVEKNSTAINPRGEIYTEDNISERLSMRDFMKDLRDGGLITGGPSTFGNKDKELFANSLNRLLTKKLKI